MTVMNTQVLGLPRGRALTRADLDSMPDDGHRYELIDGILVVSPAPRWSHQRAVSRLIQILGAACPENLEALVAPFDVILADDTVIQPDLIVTPIADLRSFGLPVAPLLAIEVLSPSTRGIDLLLKKDRLARAGCRHYWTVDPDAPSITAWTLTDGEYRRTAEAVGDEEFTVDGPLPVSLTPAGLVA